MPHKYLILVIVYNEKIKDSSTYKSIISTKENLTNSTLIIWDNSKNNQKINNNELCFFKCVQYIHTPNNLSLSKIYNKVIQSNEEYDYMIILDQDSSFSKNYFKQIQNSIKNNSTINLFLPIVKSDTTIVSPGDYKIFKGSYWKKEKYGKIKSKNILAINSGMVINFNYLKKEFKGYDERLRFYGVDTFFMFEYAKSNKYFYVLDYTFNHESALLNNKENIDKKIFRLTDLFYSWKITNEYKKYNLFFIKIYITFKIVKLVLKNKNLNYFKLFKIKKDND